MNGSVWKYDLPVDDDVDLEMPAGATILAVQTQGGAPRLWALVDPLAPKETRRFRVAGTGHAILDADRLTYVGTFQLVAGAFVGHVFERPS